jgi:hypothetical protein
MIESNGSTLNELHRLAQTSGLRESIFVGRLIAELLT